MRRRRQNEGLRWVILIQKWRRQGLCLRVLARNREIGRNNLAIIDEETQRNRSLSQEQASEIWQWVVRLHAVRVCAAHCDLARRHIYVFHSQSACDF